MRWMGALLAMVIGVGLGLAYGWGLNPVRFSETTPASLRIDYRTDYVLMVAESFHAHADPDLARRQLAIFGGQSPPMICGQALLEARRAAYSEEDLALLEELQRAMQPFLPSPTPDPGAP